LRDALHILIKIHLPAISPPDITTGILENITIEEGITRITIGIKEIILIRIDPSINILRVGITMKVIPDINNIKNRRRNNAKN